MALVDSLDVTGVVVVVAEDVIVVGTAALGDATTAA